MATIKATVLNFAGGIGGAVEIEDVESDDRVDLERTAGKLMG